MPILENGARSTTLGHFAVSLFLGMAGVGYSKALAPPTRVQLRSNRFQDAFKFDFSFGRVQLLEISTGRFVYIMVLCALRGIVAVTLLFAGVKYLALTLSIEDIFLNAVALEFIINVDELIFQVLLPAKTRTFIMRIAPLKLPHPRSWY